jgi:hypothetical protein
MFYIIYMHIYTNQKKKKKLKHHGSFNFEKEGFWFLLSPAIPSPATAPADSEAALRGEGQLDQHPTFPLRFVRCVCFCKFFSHPT